MLPPATGRNSDIGVDRPETVACGICTIGVDVVWGVVVCGICTIDVGVDWGVVVCGICTIDVGVDWGGSGLWHLHNRRGCGLWVIRTLQ